MPPGYLFTVQRALGIALKIDHKLGGFKVRYTLVTNRNTDPPITISLDIFIKPTPTVKDRQRVGGRYQEVLSAAGVLSAEAQPVFQVSRDSLRTTAGVRFDPTTDDEFQELDATGTPTGPLFHVEQTTPIGFIPGGWLLKVRTAFHSAPSG